MNDNQALSGSQGQVRYTTEKRRFLRNAPRYGKDAGLGPEWALVQKIVQMSGPKSQWSYVQKYTQDAAARDFGMTTRTYKRHLSALRRSGVLISQVARVENPPAYLDPATAYPIFTVHPVVVRECVEWNSKSMVWPRGTLFERIQSADATVSNRHVVPVSNRHVVDIPNSMRMALNACQIGTYRAPSETPELALNEEYEECREPLCHKGSAVLSNPKLRTKHITSTCTSSSDVHVPVQVTPNQVWRLRRTERKDTPVVSLWKRPPEDDYGFDDSPVLGADPDTKPKPKGSPSSRVARHFTDEWNRNRTGSGYIPMFPYAPGRKVAFNAWVKNTLMPAFGGDESYVCEVITHYCENALTRPSYFDSSKDYPVWSQFWHAVENVKQDLSGTGVKSAAELAEQAAHAAAAERKRIEWETQRDRILQEQAQDEERQSRKPRMVPSSEMDWTLDN